MASSSNQLGPSDVIGRDDFIRHLWHVLETRSLILSAERRFGKTSVIQKMMSEAPSNVLPFYQDVGHIQTVREFSDYIFAGVRRNIGVAHWLPREMEGRLSRFHGAKVNVKPPHPIPDVPDLSFDLPTVEPSPWKIQLTELITLLVERQPGQDRVVFFWDEVPWMVENISRREGEGIARELLDTLRVLRQHPTLRVKLRMVYTGSIGFHHVISSPPINDMRPHIEVLPLSANDAQLLARLLLADAAVSTTDLDATAKAIAEAADGVPFYIKNIVECFYQEGHDIGPNDVLTRVADILEQSPESWELPHYDQRIDMYYTDAQRPFARALLDILAGADTVADFDTLFNLLKSQRATEDESLARKVLNLLRQDHYINSHPYRFRMPLIRRFWRIRRGV